MTRSIGIDLGTTNSVVAYVEGSRAETIPNSEGHATTPSVVLLREDDLVVGELAKRQLVTQPHNTVRSVKRLMGQRYSEVKDRLSDYFFKIVEGPNDQALIQLGDLIVSPEEVSAAVLTKMRLTAEDFLNEDIDQAVITVPAHFNDSQRTATKKAAEMAGLEVLRIINEPTAAALAYGIDKQREELVAVFDFGGGTFDISILQISKGIFEVLSTNGDTQLGGDNLDRILIQWIIDGIREETGCNPEKDIQALQRIREAAERTKCELSSLTSTTVSLPFVVADHSGPKHFTREITRDHFIALAQPVLESLVPPCRQAMLDAGVKHDAISRVLLVGGSTRIPEVRRIVHEVFKKPASHEVNPDEAVGLGAAIQSGIISGSLQEVLLLDVVPLSLGIELAGGIFKPLIPRNASVPTTATRKFTTVVDNQSSVMVHVLQGERKTAKENRTLARLRLTGIAAAPREVPEIEVRFHIDANGILQVSAQDMTSGTANSITIESYSAAIPSEEEIERAVRNAQEHAAEDDSLVAHARHLERIQQMQVQMDRFLQVVDGVAEQDIKAIKEGMIRLDLAARAREWMEIDTAELEFKMIKGKYGPVDQVTSLLSRAVPGAKNKPSLSPAVTRAAHGGAGTGKPAAGAEAAKAGSDSAAAGSGAKSAEEDQGGADEDVLVFESVRGEAVDGPETASAAHGPIGVAGAGGGSGIGPPAERPLPRPKERDLPVPSRPAQIPAARPRAVPAHADSDEGKTPDLPDRAEPAATNAPPDDSAPAAAAPKKFTPPSWLFPAPGKGQQKP